MKIGIIGYGHVGKAMKKLFKNAIVYDINNQENIILSTKEDINNCDVSFICVPTPMNKDGSCDTGIVEEVIKWCKSKLLIIRSTIEIGFTDRMVEKYKKYIVFQP